ncbi:MAG: hypothetical protein AB7U73_15930 [Pirellulales bacterium]
MLSYERPAAIALAVLGILLLAGNLWVTAARSTIPLAIDGRVTALEVRHEKHPGADDVCFVTLDNGSVLHVDTEVFRAIQKGEHLHKSVWQRTLDHGDAIVSLDCSADARGMWRVMSVALAAIVVVCVWACVRSVESRR